jgi:syntaxin 5
MAPTNDRTAEFFAIADARCKQRGRAPATRQRAAKTPFGETAQRLGRALHATEARTSRLQKLACKSSLFDDPAAEINEINLAVRRELSGAATGLDALGSAKRPGSNQFAAHADALLAWLRARMAAVTSDFQAALKQREATISAKESRAAQLGVASVASPFATPFAAPAAPKAFGSSCGGACGSSSSSARLACGSSSSRLGVSGGWLGTLDEEVAVAGQQLAVQQPRSQLRAQHALRMPHEHAQRVT